MFAQSSSPLDVCEGWRKKTNEIPNNERIRGMIMSSFAALKSMNGMDISDLEFHQATLRAERDIAKKFDTKTTMDPCRLFFYGFSECIEGLLSTIIERIGEIEAMNDGEKEDETHSLSEAATADVPSTSESSVPKDPVDNTASIVPPPQALSLVDGDDQDPIMKEDRATSALVRGNSVPVVIASPQSAISTGDTQPIQAPSDVSEPLGKGMVKMEDIDEEEDSLSGDVLMDQSHSGSDASHSVVKEEEMPKEEHPAPPVAPYPFQVRNPIAAVTMGQFQGGNLLQLAGMIRRPTQSVNDVDAPSTSSSSAAPSGSKTTAQKFLELPNQRLYYRAPRPTLHAVGKKLLKRDSNRPKFNKETDNKKTLHCLFCHMRDMNLDTFVEHLLHGHNTTPSKSRLGFRCTCGFVGKTAKAARLHKYSCRNCELTMIKTVKDRR